MVSTLLADERVQVGSSDLSSAILEGSDRTVELLLSKESVLAEINSEVSGALLLSRAAIALIGRLQCPTLHCKVKSLN